MPKGVEHHTGGGWWLLPLTEVTVRPEPSAPTVRVQVYGLLCPSGRRCWDVLPAVAPLHVRLREPSIN